MKNKILKFLLFVGAVSAVLTSCVKDDYDTGDLGDAGTTSVKFSEAPEKKMFFLPFTDVKKTDLFSLRRDATSSDQLNQSATVKLVSAPTMITNYNNTNGESLVALPDNFYTITNSAFVKTTEGYTVNMSPGTFASDLTIMLDGSKWLDLTKKYAVAFRIKDASGLRINNATDSVIVVLAIANKYDGIYELTASLSAGDRPTVNATGSEWTWPGDVWLVTTSATTVNLFDNWGFGTYILPIQTNTGGWSGFGSTNPRFTFDLTTNKITAVSNSTLNPANGRAFVIDPSGLNYFDPSTHAVYASFFMTQPGFTPLAIKVSFKYKKAR